jgi:hypothetical protein
MFDVSYEFIMQEHEVEDPVAQQNNGRTLTIPLWVHGVQVAHPEFADKTILGTSWVLSAFDNPDPEAEQRMEALINLSTNGGGIITFNPDFDHPLIKDTFR